MSKKFKINLPSIIVTVITSLFVTGVLVVYANWTPPPSAAPTCPASEPGCNAPINVGNAGQRKIGTLSIGGALGVDGIIQTLGGLLFPDGTLQTTAALKSSVMYIGVASNGCTAGEKLPPSCPSGWRDAVGCLESPGATATRICTRTDVSCAVMYIGVASNGCTAGEKLPPSCPSGWIDAVGCLEGSGYGYESGAGATRICTRCQ